jgi:hypothetical protein
MMDPGPTRIESMFHMTKLFMVTLFRNTMTHHLQDIMVASKQQRTFYATTGGPQFNMMSRFTLKDVKHVNEPNLTDFLQKPHFTPSNHPHDPGT